MPATVAPNRFKAHQGRISQIRIRGFVGSFPSLEQPPGETTHLPQRSISLFARTDPFMFFLPPYSPELNPDEQVWRDLKGNGIGRSEIIDRDDLEQKVVSHLDGLRGLPKKIRSFFQLPMTRYAAA